MKSVTNTASADSDAARGDPETSRPSAGGQARTESKVVIYAAIAADAGIAVAKFIAAALSGSSSMLTEGIHSVIDTANTCLLLLGQKRAARPPDPEHPFGHGREIFFWSLLVAMVIFGLGGGTSTYEGINHLLHPLPLESAAVSYWVLGASTVFGIGSFWLSVRQFARRKRDEDGWWQAFRRSKDPAIFTVMLEDAAALLGIVLAFLGVFLGHTLNNRYCDGIASVSIGLMLATVACLLAWESRSLLVGESADPEAVEKMRALAASDADVLDVARPLSMQLGPDEILLTLDVVFREGLTVQQLSAAIDRLEQNIRTHYPQVRKIFIEAQALANQK